MNPKANATRENEWETLPFPLSDVFLQQIAPNYLTITEFLNLGMVSKRYKDLFGVKTEKGNEILGGLMLEEAKHYHPVTKQLLYTDQLPTIGNLSVKESLKQDAMFVLKLRGPAERRRSLVLLPKAEMFESEEHRGQLQEMIATKFRPNSGGHVTNVARLYNHRLLIQSTQFLVANLNLQAIRK